HGQGHAYGEPDPLGRARSSQADHLSLCEHGDLRKPVMRPLHGRRGQNLVEVALVLPILVIMMLGIVEFGFIYFVWGSVDNAVREGARYGAINPTDTTGIANRVKQTV